MRCWEHAPKRDTYRLEGGHTHHTLLACANRARDAPPANSARLEFPCQPSLSPLPPPPPSTTHPVSCGFASPDPVSTFRLLPPSFPPALTEFQCEKAFLSRKIEGKKKKEKCIEFALDYRLSSKPQQRPSSFCFSSSSREYIRVNPHLCPSLYIRRGDPFLTYEKVRGVSCFALTTFRFERFSVLDKGIFVSFKSGNCQ